MKDPQSRHISRTVRDTEMTRCTFGDTNVFFYFPKFDRNRGSHWLHFCLYKLEAILSPPAFEILSI